MPRTVHRDPCILELRQWQPTGHVDGSENSSRHVTCLHGPSDREGSPASGLLCCILPRGHPCNPAWPWRVAGLLGQPSDDITRGCCWPCGWFKELSELQPSCPSPTTAKACHSAALYKSTIGLSCNFFKRTYTAPSGTGARFFIYRKRSCGATGLQFGAPLFCFV